MWWKIKDWIAVVTIPIWFKLKKPRLWTQI